MLATTADCQVPKDTHQVVVKVTTGKGIMIVDHSSKLNATDSLRIICVGSFLKC
jgi:hypothetical protein